MERIPLPPQDGDKHEKNLAIVEALLGRETAEKYDRSAVKASVAETPYTPSAEDSAEIARLLAEAEANKETNLDTIEIKTDNGVYEVLKLLREGDTSISGEEMSSLAKEMNAQLGEEDCNYLLEHEYEIPKELQDDYLIFPGWRCPGNPDSVAVLYWSGGRWIQNWHGVEDDWYGHDRLVRRK